MVAIDQQLRKLYSYNSVPSWLYLSLHFRIFLKYLVFSSHALHVVYVSAICK